MAFVNANAFEELIAAVVAERNLWKERAEAEILAIQRVNTSMPSTQLNSDTVGRWIYLGGTKHHATSIEKLNQIVNRFQDYHASLVAKYEEQCSRNDAALENNKRVVAAVKDLMTRIGIAETYREVDSKSKARSPAWKTHKAGYLEDLARNAVTNDRRDAARRMIEDYAERFKSWEWHVRRALCAEASELAAKEMREKQRVNSVATYVRLITTYANGNTVDPVLLVDLLLKKVNSERIKDAYEECEEWVGCDDSDEVPTLDYFDQMCREAINVANSNEQIAAIKDLKIAVNLVQTHFKL